MVKQVIVIRKDLRMRRGKEIAQGAHASMKWLADRITQLPPGGNWTDRLNLDLRLSEDEEEWLFGRFTKICLQVDTEEALLAIYKTAKDARLTSFLVQDAGATEFDGIPTYTAVAIGPNDADKIDAVTGHLKLY